MSFKTWWSLRRLSAQLTNREKREMRSSARLAVQQRHTQRRICRRGPGRIDARCNSTPDSRSKACAAGSTMAKASKCGSGDTTGFCGKPVSREQQHFAVGLGEELLDSQGRSRAFPWQHDTFFSGTAARVPPLSTQHNPGGKASIKLVTTATVC